MRTGGEEGNAEEGEGKENKEGSRRCHFLPRLKGAAKHLSNRMYNAEELGDEDRAWCTGGHTSK